VSRDHSTSPSLDRLTELAPPSSTAEIPDWERTEQALGSQLPSAYKLLVERYGCGRFGGHVRLFTPRRHARDFDIVTNNVEYTENMEDLWEGEPDAPDDIAEGSENKLIIWADTDDGDHLTWFVHPGQNPDSWQIMTISSDALRWEYHELSCIDFLYGILTGTVESDVVTLRNPSPPAFKSLDA
jgi:hypothetical protein